jgi:hypothetical protein
MDALPLRQRSAVEQRAYFAERARIWRLLNPDKEAANQHKYYERHRAERLRAAQIRYYSAKEAAVVQV